MKSIAINELQVGKLYLFRYGNNVRQTIFQAGRFCGLHPCGEPVVEWCIQGHRSTVDKNAKIAPLTKTWLQINIESLEVQAEMLKVQAGTLADLAKEVE